MNFIQTGFEDAGKPSHSNRAQEDQQLLDYEEDSPIEDNARPAPPAKSGHTSMHNSTFKDFLLKDELLRAIADFGFEHPSEGSNPISNMSDGLQSSTSASHKRRWVAT